MPEIKTFHPPKTGAQIAHRIVPADSRFQRPTIKGKFLYVGDEKWSLRGVTYGTFRPQGPRQEEYSPDRAEADFALMAANGINAVRTYTVPPRWLLDSALRHGLRVMVGLPWEQHVAFLDEFDRPTQIEKRLRSGVAGCAGHPALLCYSIGNEIPAPIVRWHGPARVERYLERLYLAAREEDPGALVTYVNYPTTEYLQLPFLDLVCFNVYLESQTALDAYLARLQNIAGERPLIMAEIGLDSRRNGEENQARTLDWQIRTTFAAGCAGAFIFSWTDEWHRGGYEIEDWDFGLTTRERKPKQALAAVGKAFAEIPFPPDLPWPMISVVVCSYNGAGTIRDCFEGLLRLDYPSFEVIVVDDGSTDETAAITKEFGFQLIRTENRGLASARNTGLAAAQGEIVAYIDDDAYPDPHWLTYLASTFMRTTHVGVGGPNLPPPGDGPIAECVANAPGGPVHVLLSDQEAEHIPGCNMAFRKSALLEVGGCDPQFRAAGDDVDLCWRLQQRGGTLGFSPAAMVWHHRRNSVVRYWKQQQGYGKAEALLARKWPEKYNAAGHLTWAGRLYGRGWTAPLGRWRARIYHGTWGSAPFQSLYEPHPTTLASLPLMPEWFFLIFFLGGLSLLSPLWSPLRAAIPLFLLAVGIPILQAWLSAGRALFHGAPRGATRLKLRTITASLHLMQPLARLIGRLRHGLSPWRRPDDGGSQVGKEAGGRDGWLLPFRRKAVSWSETWKSAESRLGALEAALKESGATPHLRCGGDFDRWDLELRGGLLGTARLQMVIEEHGGGRQLVRYRLQPGIRSEGGILLILALLLSAAAAGDGAWIPAGLFGAATLFLFWRTIREWGRGLSAFLAAIERTEEERCSR
ncbi:glycosyltransferase [Nitrospiraceae bacterium HYJII51-Mn-bac16s-1-B09]|uniref:Glycosyltransferase n=2 Tax=Candidatus Manganitrophus noduliformans TaxID=2606439 RepID=A0A7X6DMT2_9BACT|nr:glycosyltransferase [Candidatus Manganitrophus noduliformans]